MKKNQTVLFLAVVFSLFACDTEKAVVANAPSSQQTESLANQIKPMKIKIKTADKEIKAVLNDSDAARDFVSLLPLNLSLEDYNKTEKISNLPKKLSTAGAPSGSDPDVGDIAYYAPWGNLAIFYKDFGYSDGLVILGKIDGDTEALKASDKMKVTIEIDE